MVINSSGFVGIGQNNPDSPLEVVGTGPSLTTFWKSNGATNDEARIMLGALSSFQPDQRGAGIAAVNNGAGHDLIIKCSASHGAGPGEKMRIDSDGNVFVDGGQNNINPGFGSNTTNGNYFANIGYGMHARNAGTALYIARNVNTGNLVSFNYNGGGQIAEISTNGSSVTYGTGSDYRLKENITTLTNAITRLKNLKPSRFNFLKTPSITQDGFIAHEVQEVVPEAVTGVKDEVLTEDGDMGDKKGDPVMQNLDVAKIVPLLTAALQEAIGRIEALEAK